MEGIYLFVLFLHKTCHKCVAHAHIQLEFLYEKFLKKKKYFFLNRKRDHRENGDDEYLIIFYKQVF